MPGPSGEPPEIKVETTSMSPILGKEVTELQTEVSVDEDQKSITGTSNYVTNYTEFSGNIDEQSGNYLYLGFNGIDADKIETKVEGGKNPEFVDATADKYCVYLLSDGATGITVKATKGDQESTKTYNISGLIKQPKM